MIKHYLAFISVFLHTATYCQTGDSIKLSKVIVSSYFSPRPLLRLPHSASIIDTTIMEKQSGLSLVPVMNSLPGIRMEERSPGSYRLSIRGSLLRSPFGVRNVKVYLDGFSLTDAGGNTYLNLIDLNSLRSVEVLKGPDGSVFGPNSGGVVQLNTLPKDSSKQLKAAIGSGSYGLFSEFISARHTFKNNTVHIIESWQRSDGYRENSKFDRKYVQLSDQFRYHKNAQLTFLLFYSNLHYQTPGGLTLDEWINSPGSARPSTSSSKGAVEQQAGISNETWFGGLSHKIILGKFWQHHISLLGASTNFKNPFITNYEFRREQTIGVRSWFEASNHNEGNLLLKLHVGAELLQTKSDIKNYGNDYGSQASPIKFDIINARQAVLFSHFLLDYQNKWLLEMGLSYNQYGYRFNASFPEVIATQKRFFKPQWMPKIALSYQIASFIAWRALVSKGYSPPALAEIRSSNNKVNTDLQPEYGWNYETGIRLHSKNNFIWWDVSVFSYQLQQAIVRQVDNTGQDDFINVGGVKQIGLESQLMLQLIEKGAYRILKGLEFTNSFTYSDFRFTKYNYVGNNVPGVPPMILVTGFTIHLPFQCYVYGQHYYASSIFLNDANSVSTTNYSVFLIKAGSTLLRNKHFALNLSAGIDNVLNEKYSLGNDLNAMGGRYYNAAMPRNFFCKVEIVL